LLFVQVAAVVYERGFPIDELLARIGSVLVADGLRLAGTIQRNLSAGVPSSPCAAMNLVDLISGDQFGISQDLGPEARGCRLDSGALAQIAAGLGRIGNESTDLIILNKFGRAEAEGHGLRELFAQAIDAAIPVLTAVREPYYAAWQQYHGGFAADLNPHFDIVLDWCRTALRQRAGTLPGANP